MSIGKTLKAAREARGLSIEDVKTATNMTETQIAYIECDDFSIFSAPVYVKGFIKLFARVVGVDPAPLVAEYMSSPNHSSEPPSPVIPLETISDGIGIETLMPNVPQREAARVAQAPEGAVRPQRVSEVDPRPGHEPVFPTPSSTLPPEPTPVAEMEKSESDLFEYSAAKKEEEVAESAAPADDVPNSATTGEEKSVSTVSQFAPKVQKKVLADPSSDFATPQKVSLPLPEKKVIAGPAASTPIAKKPEALPEKKVAPVEHGIQPISFPEKVIIETPQQVFPPATKQPEPESPVRKYAAEGTTPIAPKPVTLSVPPFVFPDPTPAVAVQSAEPVAVLESERSEIIVEKPAKSATASSTVAKSETLPTKIISPATESVSGESSDTAEEASNASLHDKMPTPIDGQSTPNPIRLLFDNIRHELSLRADNARLEREAKSQPAAAPSSGRRMTLRGKVTIAIVVLILCGAIAAIITSCSVRGHNNDPATNIANSDQATAMEPDVNAIESSELSPAAATTNGEEDLSAYREPRIIFPNPRSFAR